MFLHQTNVLVYPSSITYDEAVRPMDYCEKSPHLNNAASASPHDSQEIARLDEDSERTSIVDYCISPTLASQVLALTWQSHIGCMFHVASCLHCFLFAGMVSA